ncbi:MAG: hypothetical protein KatS3mg110_3987 [Pirellulaceae bacterium]|nr:MAG: hypothetical protein KatS3mg110_3987 [Pirellulaceae bacterium]
MAVFGNDSAWQRLKRTFVEGRAVILLSGILLALVPPFLLILLGSWLKLTIRDENAHPVFDSVLRMVQSVTGTSADTAVPRALYGGLAVMALALAFLQAVLGQWYRRAIYRAANRAASTLRRQVHAQVFRLGTQDALGEERSWPREIFLDRIEHIRLGLVHWYRTMPHAVLLLVLLVALALMLNVWLALLTIALALLVVRWDRWLFEQAQRASRRFADQARLAGEYLAETMNLAPLAVGYAMSSSPAGPIAERLRQQEQQSLRADLASAVRTPWYWFVVLGCVVFWLLLVSLSQQASVVNSLIVLLALAGAWFPLMRIRRWRSEQLECLRAAKEVVHFLDREPPVQDLPAAQPLGRLNHQLKFDAVTVVDRHGNKLLDQVSFSIAAGSRTALVASHPRTTRALIELMPRLADPTSGRVLFDEQDLRFATVESARRQTLLVLRDALVFTGSVTENITCGESSFSTDQIHDAAKKSQIIDVVLTLPDNFETIIGKHGHQLNVWQEFRVALARALIRNPSVLVVEEPLVPPPEADQQAVELALQNAAAGRTLILVSRRLPALRSADTVMLFHQGRLVGQGKHAELLQQSDLYRHLNYMWFNPFPDIR